MASFRVVRSMVLVLLFYVVVGDVVLHVSTGEK